MKHCTRCTLDKSKENDFYKSSKSPDGRQGWCKACCKDARYQKVLARRDETPFLPPPNSGLHGPIVMQAMPGLSTNLQVGKAGEHLVCTDLILQGYNAFLADAGLPFDVVVAVGDRLLRVQVKTTMGLWECPKSWGKIYRFGLRGGKVRRRINTGFVDALAFVALDTLTIAYLPVLALATADGKLKSIIEFKSRKVDYGGRTYANGSIREARWCKFIEDYWRFPNGS